MPEPSFDIATYYPIFAYLALLVVFTAGVLVATHVIGPRKKTPVKQMPYESGMDPIGDARMHFDIRFYVVAIMFLVFDVELLFLYPWAVAAYRDGGAPSDVMAGETRPAGSGFGDVLAGPVFWCVLAFILLLFVAYVYDWKKGVFRWR